MLSEIFLTGYPSEKGQKMIHGAPHNLCFPNEEIVGFGDIAGISDGYRLVINLLPYLIMRCEKVPCAICILV